MAASYDVSVTVESDHWGNLLVDMPYTPGYSPVTSGPPDNWDPGDPGDWDLSKAKVTFLDLNIGKTYPINRLAPRVFEYLDNWLYHNADKWQPEVEGGYDDYDDYYDDGY
jgi:hypothetical protein